MKKYILCAIAGIAIMVSSCNSTNAKHVNEAVYAPLDSVPFNVEMNNAAITTMTHLFPEVTMFTSTYPDMDAEVDYAIVTRSDTAGIIKVVNRQLDKMAADIIHDGCIIDAIHAENGMNGWIFTSIPDKYPVQMLVSDSAKIAIHARMKFTKPKTDTLGSVIPATRTVISDMTHLITNLKLR